MEGIKMQSSTCCRHAELVSASSQNGFTLIELLVVVLIIGILSAVALPQYQRAVDKARASEAFLSLKALSDASAVYYLQNGSYTGMTMDTLDVSVPPDGKSFRFELGGWLIYEPNHMDIVAWDKQGRYKLVGVHYDGARSRTYCNTSSRTDICRSLGAVSCQVNQQCNLP